MDLKKLFDKLGEIEQMIVEIRRELQTTVIESQSTEDDKNLYAVSLQDYYSGSDRCRCEGRSGSCQDNLCPGQPFVLQLFDNYNAAVAAMPEIGKRICLCYSDSNEDTEILRTQNINGEPSVILNDKPLYPSRLLIEIGTGRELSRRREMARSWVWRGHIIDENECEGYRAITLLGLESVFTS